MSAIGTPSGAGSGTASAAVAAWPAGTPAAAKAHTPLGAVNFAQFYFDRANEAWSRPDARLLDGFGDAGCTSCQSMIRGAKDLEAAGQRYERGPAALTNLMYGGVQAGHTLVNIDGMQRKTRIIDATGAVVREVPERPLVNVVDLVWQEGRWHIYDVG